MNKSPIEIIKSIKPFGYSLIENEPNHRYITSIWKDGAGNYEIHGAAGTMRYMWYSKRDAIKAYNKLAREAC